MIYGLFNVDGRKLKYLYGTEWGFYNNFTTYDRYLRCTTRILGMTRIMSGCAETCAIATIHSKDEDVEEYDEIYEIKE